MGRNFCLKAILSLSFGCFLTCSVGQNPQASNTGIRVLFYNVENLFHPSDDSLKNDDAFTKEGQRYWSYNRYYDKVTKIGKVAIATGEWEPPAVIGLCEIENRQCLKDLVHSSPLKRFGYEIVHQESGDRRGIDVALLYRPAHYRLLHFEAIPLPLGAASRPTRDILYVQGLVGSDTLHLFVNHWPSRYGGLLATAPKRALAATTLRSKCDSILATNPHAAILLMGDFNDHPDDHSMHDLLRAKKDTHQMKTGDFLNLMSQYEFEKGTHKHAHQWGILDQFVITLGLINGHSGLKIPLHRAVIFDADFLLESEKDGIGKRPNRTYIGFNYHGGYSDHLPIFTDVLSTGN